MRRYDNATPKGILLGDGKPLPAGPCCRDGYARLSLRRPFQWVRPEPPTLDDAMKRVYLLCPRCTQRRIERGATETSNTYWNPNLAY